MVKQILLFTELCLLLLSMVTLNAQVATIDLNNEKQPISGFGGAHYPEWVVELTLDQVDKVFGNNPGQIGLNILRMPVPLDSTIFPMEVPAAARAKENGALLIASPWSPPPWMKTNNNANGGSLDPSHYGDFANHLDSFSSYMAANDASLYAISLQNESDWLATYASCIWTPAELVNFLANYGSSISSTKIMAAESYNFDHTMTDPILNDAEAEAELDIVAGHIYGSGIADYPLARDKGKEVWMTEHYIGGTSYAEALATGKEIHDCMLANFNAYVYWYIQGETGFLSDGGDISKRGYVMSQYAKFVRPGCTRVDAITNSAPNVDVTAYKTDSSVVIVVINRNTTPFDLDFTIQNGTEYIFTKFTTSESKNVLNEGVDTTSGGAFTTTLDASSITTFTTIPDNGGQFGNTPPIANAGIDQTFMDTDNNGYESVSLDGSASSDPDGTVTIYTWSEAGNEIASGVQPMVDIATGVHDILLTITDSDGATATDSVTIIVNMASGVEEVHVWLEAECGTVGSLWSINPNPDASNEYYVVITSGNNSTASASENPADQLSFNFNITEDGNYTLWGRCRVPTADDDSYWIKMDDGEWVMWNSISGGATYQWDDVHNSNAGSAVVVYPLTTGSHTLTIAYREDGALLDKIYITNTGTVPTGLGDTAINVCEFVNVKQPIKTNNELTVYPNPFADMAIIEFNLDRQEYINLSIVDLTGRTIAVLYNGAGHTGKNNISIDGSLLDKGMYLCRFKTGSGTQTKQIMIIR